MIMNQNRLYAYYSVYENLQATRAKGAEATYGVSQNILDFVNSLYLQEVDVNESPFV